MKFSSPKKRYVGVIFLLAMLFSNLAKAQKEEPNKDGEVDFVTLHSAVLQEERQVMIYAPEDSLNAESSYPVIYILDPNNHFDIMVEYSKYLSRENVGSAPSLIVVGIVTKDRARDLTPSQSRYDYSGKLDTNATSPYNNSGGNDRLFEFIKSELMPYVNTNYKTRPYQIFAGHSFGGLTTINCMLNYPGLFNAFIAVSPSFWWDRKSLLKAAAEKLTPETLNSNVLFYSVGNEDLTFRSDILTFDTLLNNLNFPGFSFEYIHYPKESHMTVPIKSYYDGLRFIFRDWEFPEMSDEVVNAEKVMNHYNRLSTRFGYEILPGEKQFKDWGESLMKTPATHENGISLLEMNTRNYPLSAEAYATLGEAYITLGRKKEALLTFEKASKLNPGSEELKMRLQQLRR